MTERIKELYSLLKSGEYKKNRFKKEIIAGKEFEAEYVLTKVADSFKTVLEYEKPYFHKNDRIGFNRSNADRPLLVKANGEKYAMCGIGNIVVDYETALNKGMDAIRNEIAEKLQDCNEEQREFYNVALGCVDSALEFADRTALEAKKSGMDELYNALCKVPHKAPETLLEACVFVKFIIFTLRSNVNAHITLGRFDKYMRPYYYADLKNGKTREELLEIIEEFFISINYDTDLYHGVQVGDNGQSLVLGGNGIFDDFSRLCMEASLELNLIDPKINLRVDKNTPDELYEFGTLMTKQGMGFPQYCNDDVVIEGLMKLGYDREDAENYAVAACWEYISSGNGMDIPNLTVMNFPKVINEATKKYLLESESFEEFLKNVKNCIVNESNRLMDSLKDYKMACSPYLSVFVGGCIENGKDLSQGGAKYNNYGIHGAGIATAADSLQAIKEVIFDSDEYSKKELLDAMDSDFEGFGELRNRLLSCKKMGNNEPEVDDLAYKIMDIFANEVNCKPNNKGGIFRAGTGSAHEYYYSAKQVSATPDGRHAFAPFGSSFSPSLEAKLNGPLSCVKSFTCYDLKNIINGGPLTLEIHDTVFRNEEGVKKVAGLVKAFVHLGGHQLQLNCINRDVLLDAMKNPEDHKNLIVRVWGWSGYFNELDIPFKEHIIKRTEFVM